MGYRMDRKRKERMRANVSPENVKRLSTLGILFTFILLGLIGRLAYIQMIKGNDYSLKAANQWFKEIPAGIKRGKIYDRNMILLTNKKKTSKLIIFPEYFISTDRNYEIVSKITGISTNELKYNRLNSKKPMIFEIKELNRKLMEEVLLIRGIFPIDYEDRYDVDGLASHVIGYINKIDNKGKKGLEKGYDKILKENREYKVGAIVDAQKRMIPGFGYQILESSRPNRKNIVTTLDYNIQKIIEEELDKSNHKGSIIVLDIKNGDILGMVSRPNFNQDHVDLYLNSDDKELFNRGLQVGYPPGSIFKIVVAAAALENNEIDINEKFFCKGYEDIGDIRIRCGSYKDHGHGEINLNEAFSVSCNAAFIQLGRKIGGEEILSMAKKMGLGSQTGIELTEEISGKLPMKDYVKGPGIGNISIGQGTIEVTPLQIAKLTSIIANDGVDKGVQLVKKIVDDQGQIIETKKKNDSKKIISQDTAQRLRGMMEQVVEKGTGKNIDLDTIGGAAGKTGSAEATYKGKRVVHAWFTGYFPKKNPKYTITVMVEDGGSGGAVAAPIFEDIIKRINN